MLSADSFELQKLGAVIFLQVFLSVALAFCLVGIFAMLVPGWG